MPDNPEQVLPAIEDQLVRADLMITTGGVSMGGEHDVVKAALQQLGTVSFRKVAMQPGMPQGFGTIDRVPIFTLPGNPVSAYVSFQVFARPAIGDQAAEVGVGEVAVLKMEDRPIALLEHGLVREVDAGAHAREVGRCYEEVQLVGVRRARSPLLALKTG